MKFLEQQYINLEKQLVDTNSRLENKERSNDEYQAKLSDIGKCQYNLIIILCYSFCFSSSTLEIVA